MGGIKIRSRISLTIGMLTVLIFISQVAFPISHGSIVENDQSKPYDSLGLSPRTTILYFENPIKVDDSQALNYEFGSMKWCNCTGSREGACPEVTAIIGAVEDQEGQALQLKYDLGNSDGCWAQVNCEFYPPLDLSAYDHLILDWQGDLNSANSLEVGLVSHGQNFFSSAYRRSTQKSWSSPLVISFNQFGEFDATNIEKIFVSAKKNPKTDNTEADSGGLGSIYLRSLKAIKANSRNVPSDFEKVDGNKEVSLAAAKWLKSQQQSTGLLKSWEEEDIPLAHIYDQALALIVFSQEENLSKNATQLAEALVGLQNKDGSWYQTYNFSNMNNTTPNKWIGDVAWAVYALNRYTELVGESPEAKIAIEKGSKWLQNQTNSSSGCLENKSVEAAIDTWWALQASGKVNESSNLRNCIIASYWDDDAGRFLAGKGDWKPVTDAQTWGAAMLKATGEKEKALRALSYAQEVLLVSSQDHQIIGLGDQAGPWSVSNECTGQYIVARGEGSNQFLRELISQQRADGAMPGSPDNFNGAGVLNTQMHGVAPTAWLYFASSSGPFNYTATA